jgi:predicted O-linked N-acetylglucosamine transferase (SPINDLY family)
MNPAAAQVSGRLRQAVAFHQSGQLAPAQAIYEEILTVEPRHFDALHLLGVIAAQSKYPARAVTLFDQAIDIDPNNAAAHCNRGAALQELSQWDAALASYEQAIALASDYFEAYYNRGNVLKDLEQFAASLDSYDRAIALKPDHAESHSNRGIVLAELEQWQAALESYGRAIALKPNYAEAHYNMGNALCVLKRFDAALASYDRAIALKPDYPEAHSNHGVALNELRRFEAALASYDRAIALKPDFSDAHANRGNVLRDLKRYEAAVASYDNAIALNSDSKYLQGMRLYTRMHVCDWRDFDEDTAQLAARIDRNEAALNPFAIMAFCGSAQRLRTAAEAWVRAECPPDPALPAIGKRATAGRIRIGYFSADFRNHAVSILTAELFERHDRSRFEVTAFSFGPDTRDEMRKRLEKAFDAFIDVRGMSERDIALLARQRGIDIAVDLSGFTDGCRPRIFARRAAPIQVGYLGYLGTMGATYMDYVIADRTIIPAADQRHYVEKIAYLPSYQANDSKRLVAEQLFTRSDLGLPSAGFVFCCFNASFKITPATFARWMRILKRVEGSVLFLYADNPAAEANLRREAHRRGVDAGRLYFGQRLPVAEYLARYRSVGLFLDTLPYNAGTTASDALWAGLPVLTCMGETFAGRVAASLLKAIQLPELIAATEEEYEELAIHLATDPRRLADVRRRLADGRLSAPLFNTALFTSHLETAYRKMVERYDADLAPEHIDIDWQSRATDSPMTRNAGPRRGT